MNRLLHFVRSPRFPIFMIVFVDVLGLGITIPVLPLFAKNQLGAAAWQITTLTSVYFAAQFLAAPWLGRLSDRLGRRPVLIVSQLGTMVSLLATGLAPSIVLVYFARLIDGLTGGNVSVAQAYLSDITDVKSRARGIGIVTAGFGLGFVFGPAFGSLVAAYFGPRLPFFVAAGVSLCTVLLSAFFLPESLPPERRQADAAAAAQMKRVSNWETLRLPSVATLLLVAFVSQFGFFVFQTIYVLWAERMLFIGQPQTVIQRDIGLILTFVGLSQVVTQFWLVGPLTQRFGEKKLVVFGNASRALAIGIMAAWPLVWVSVSVIPALAFGAGVSLPTLIALLTYAAPPDRRGQVVGWQQSAAALGSVVGPVLSGFLFENVGPNAPMVAAALLIGLAALIGANLFRLPVGLPAAEAAHPPP